MVTDFLMSFVGIAIFGAGAALVILSRNDDRRRRIFGSVVCMVGGIVAGFYILRDLA